MTRASDMTNLRRRWQNCGSANITTTSNTRTGLGMRNTWFIGGAEKASLC